MLLYKEFFLTSLNSLTLSQFFSNRSKLARGEVKGAMTWRLSICGDRAIVMSISAGGGRGQAGGDHVDVPVVAKAVLLWAQVCRWLRLASSSECGWADGGDRCPPLSTGVGDVLLRARTSGPPLSVGGDERRREGTVGTRWWMKLSGAGRWARAWIRFT
jgi:hypothetical protein